ncbi:OmpA family protein [bacterium]|nr:OmpA family protein [bacterium]
MGKKIALVLFGTALSLFAEFNRSSLLIDIPTAYVLRHKVIQGTAVGAFSLAVADPRSPYDLDVCVGAGIGDFLELSLSAYSFENYALGVTALLVREGKYYPSLAIGMHEITWVPYIGSFGGGTDPAAGNNDPEDRLITGKPGFSYWEQQEWFSAFAVASKQFGKYFRTHLGLGRGRYTGYYGFERYLNTDIFNNTGVSNFAFGLFGAFEFNYEEWLSIAAEYDGRDINLGTKVGFSNWEVYFAATRLENLMYPSSGYYPWLTAGLNFYTSPHSALKGSTLSGRVLYPSGEAAPGANVEIIGDDYDQSAVSTENGAYRLRALPQGSYKVAASLEGFRSKTVTVKTNSSSNTKLDLLLEDISNKGTIQGKVLDGDDGTGIIANVYIIEANDVVRAGPRNGEYRIVGLDAGKYSLRAESKGYFDREITCQAEASRTTEMNIVLSKSWTIFHFKPGEKMIEPRYIPVLEDVVKFLKDRPNMVVEIQGHTDSIGDAKENRELSRSRAEAVRDYLVKRGIGEKRLIVKGYGELSPIGDNRTVLGRDMNRRVELKVISE